MFRSIFLKEWLKTRRIFFVLLLVMTAAAVYTVLKINAAVESRGIVSLWLAMLLKDITYLDILLWLPVACGISVAIAQYVPETSYYRLKLTLHLPVGRNRLIAAMLSVGIVELAIIFIVQLVIVGGYYSYIIHTSMLQSVIATLVPRYLAGLAAYLLVTAIILEGKWNRRLLLTFISVVVILLYSQNLSVMNAYGLWMIFGLIIFLPMAACLVFGSVIRFKEGLRD
ncbi:MAG: hypothetical protein K2I64_01765 [Muribaculaceae bacterium]|nr:hypothetical protein [Muribaculaceae bacterium]